MMLTEHRAHGGPPSKGGGRQEKEGDYGVLRGGEKEEKKTTGRYVRGRMTSGEKKSRYPSGKDHRGGKPNGVGAATFFKKKN